MLIVTAHNIAQEGNIASYEVVVRVNERVIQEFTLHDYDRTFGWTGLLRQIAADGELIAEKQGGSKCK
jgi:hypothetical protein